MFTYRIFKKFYFFIMLMLLILCVGTSGFMIIEKWSFLDSLYMTIITISTVGFGEVHPLSMEGRMFTAFLIVTCFGTFAYTISMLTSYIVGGEYKLNLREYKVRKKVNRMEGHVIICGFGRVGRQVAEDLRHYGHKFVIIENNDLVLSENELEKELVFIKGDSTKDGILEAAGIDKAKALITCLPKDADNIYVVLSTRQMNKSLNIVSRATSGSAISKLKIAGASHVIMPDSIGGSHMAALINNADVVEFMDAIKVQGNTGVNIESISFNELPSEFRNKTIGQLEAKRITGVTIVGFKTPDGEYIINPDFEIEVVPHSKLFVLGSADQIKKLNEHFGINH
jgi:voltage-gated potassium channel